MANATKPTSRSTAVAVGLIAAAALGIYGYRGWQRAQAVGRASDDWGSFARCLLGPPLAAGELPSARLRNIELGRGGASAGTWPRRCAAAARAALRDLEPLARVTPFDRAHEGLARTLPALDRGEPPPEVDALWEAMAAAGIVAHGAAGAPSPPPPAAPLRGEALAKVVARAVTGPVSDSGPAGDVRLLFVGTPSVGCVIAAGTRPGEALSESRCGDLPGVPARGATLVVADGDDGAPVYVVARTREGAKLFGPGPDAREVFSAPALDAFVRRDSTVFVLAHDATGPRLVRIRPGGEPETLALVPSLPGSAFEPKLVRDRVVYVSETRAPGDGHEGEGADERGRRPDIESHVRSWTLPSAGPVGPDVAAGDVRSELGRIRACRTPEATIVVAEGPEAHEQIPVHVLFGGQNGWRGPVEGLVSIVASTLTCRASEATFVWVEAAASRAPGSYRVARLRCAPEGCTSATADVVDAGTDPLVAELGGRTLLIGRDPIHRTLRMRIAPLDELARARPGVLVDGARFGGADVIAQSLFARGDLAVLVLRTPTDVRAIRIDAAGGFRSVVAR